MVSARGPIPPSSCPEWGTRGRATCRYRPITPYWSSNTRAGYVRSSNTRAGYVRLFNTRAAYVRLSNTRAGYVRWSNTRAAYVW